MEHFLLELLDQTAFVLLELCIPNNGVVRVYLMST